MKYKVEYRHGGKVKELGFDDFDEARTAFHKEVESRKGTLITMWSARYDRDGNFEEWVFTDTSTAYR